MGGEPLNRGPKTRPPQTSPLSSCGLRLSLPEAGMGKNGVPLRFSPTPVWEAEAALWLTTKGRVWWAAVALRCLPSNHPPFLGNVPNFISAVHTSPSNPLCLWGIDVTMGSRVGTQDHAHSPPVTGSGRAYDPCGPRRVLLWAAWKVASSPSQESLPEPPSLSTWTWTREPQLRELLYPFGPHGGNNRRRLPHRGACRET